MPKWVKGQSGNPRGRASAPIERTVKQQAARHAAASFKALAEIVKDQKAPPASRVSAASTLLDRAFGRAPQDVTVRGGLEQHIINLIRGLDKPDQSNSDTAAGDTGTQTETQGEKPHTTH